MNKNIEIKVYPIKLLIMQIEKGKIQLDNTATILTSSYDIDASKLSGVNLQLLLRFDDITENSSNAFNSEYAENTKSFIDELPEQITTLYVCCDAGVSRSSAIAATINKYLGRDDLYIWEDPHYSPNPLVYKILCKELGIDISPQKLKQLITINENALTNAINNARK